MHQSFIVTKWGWTLWTFLHFTISGTRCLVTVHQPPVLTAALGHDVIMPCQLNLSPEEKLVVPPVLYWVYLTQDSTDNPRLWIPSEKYDGRVDLLDHNPNGSNKSILLKNVQWADSGKYLCKLSLTTQRDKSFRKKGNETLLKVYDTMMFNVTSHNDSLLRCEVNVTQDPRFVLSILHYGFKLQAVDSAPGDAGPALPYVTLSETIRLWSQGEYECQLHLNGDLITKSTFHYNPPGVNTSASDIFFAVVPASSQLSLSIQTSEEKLKNNLAEDGGDDEKNVTLTCPTMVSGMVVYPEPWLLYMAFLLVHIIILLSLVTALMYRCKV